MALNLGELSIGLELENDKFRAGLAGVKRELESIPPTARREMVNVSRAFDEGGERSGGLLAQGVRSGFIRNSPLIVAGVGAALAAGAPLMTAAAGTLFAGVGAAAAAQTVEVRSAWSNLGRDIRDGAVEDAAVLVPVYVEMADRIGGAFRKMRPELRQAFEDSAPLIRSFTDGVIALGTNAMPGLSRSIAGAGPVFEGFESFLASTGQGLSDFFDALTASSPAAGSAFASLGDILGDLLPILGELLGQGAELAADVLPAVAAATGLALDVLQALGPILPAIASGFVAFKAASAAAGYMQTFAVQAQIATTAMSGSVNAGTKVGGVLAGIGRALPGVGVAVGVVSAAMAIGEQRIKGWTQALLEGGEAAARARAEMTDESWVDQGIFATGSFTWLREIAGWMGEGEMAAGSAREEYDRLVASMDGLERAELEVTQAQSYLNQQVGEFGSGSNQAEGASRLLAAAQRELAREQANLELATSGVTSAMIAQAEQALAAIDSGFAYRKSVDDLEDAQANLAETIANRTSADENLRTTQEDVARAGLAVEEQAYKTALAFGQQQADVSGLSTESAEYARIVQEQTLAKLYELQSAAGPEMAAAIGQQIASLTASGVALTGTATSASSTAARMRDLGLSVTQVPGNKTVFIDAPTAEQKARLENLGYVVRTLPNGRIYVTADTSPAAGSLAAFMNQQRSIRIRVNLERGTTASGLGPMTGAFARDGGNVGRVVRGFSGGGRLDGPGTPTSDSITAITSSGSLLGVSDEEWVIQARSARKYGDEVMAAINAGTAQVSLAGRGLAGGGPVSGVTETATRERGPLFHADKVEFVSGTPRDVEELLAYRARTRGW